MANPSDLPLAPSGLPNDQLGQLAEFVRRAYPECQRHFRSYQEYRFAIGLALIKARGLLATDPGRRNATGRNQHSMRPVDNVSTGLASSITNDLRRIGNGSTSLQGGANFGQEEAGLMNWCRREFPEIQYRTLTRYRAWVEFEALPVIRKAWDQLELQLEDPRDLDVLALPAPKRAAVAALLREATTARDMTLTLRAEGLAKGSPENYGPVGGDNTPRDKDGKRIQRTRWELLQEKQAIANLQVSAMIRSMADFDEKTAVLADLGKLNELSAMAEAFADGVKRVIKSRKEALR